MEEWKEVKFGDICEFNPKETIKKGTLAKKISMDKITPKSKFIGSYELDAFSSGSKFRNDDILMARITPCLQNGKISKVTILEENEVAFGSTEFIVLRANHDIADFDFLYYLSICDFVKSKAIKSMSGTSGRQRVQNDILINTSISLPPLKTQKQISKILSSLDDKIELNKKINNTLEEMAQAIFKNWFVDFEPFDGVMPSDWEVKSLGDIANFKYGTMPKKEKILENGFPIFSGYKIVGYYSEKMFSSRQLIIVARGVGGTGDIKYTPENCYLTNLSIAIIIENKALENYIYRTLLNNDMSILNTGTAQPQITINSLEKFKIIMPSEEIIYSFSELTKALEEKKISNEIEIEVLKNIRDILLPKLMRGEIKLDKI